MIDPAGTTPGIQKEEKPKTVALMCRNGCGGREATVVASSNDGESGGNGYACTKCGRTWFVSLGGRINI